MAYRKIAQEEYEATEAVCTKCGETKPVEEFGKANTSLGRASQCLECAREYNRSYYEKEKSTGKWNLYSRANGLKRNYGLTEDEYEELLAEQDGGCAICGIADGGLHKQTGKQKKLAVDHNDETGQVRGLLCQKHNMGLGQFDHDIDLLMAAVAYLIKAGEA